MRAAPVQLSLDVGERNGATFSPCGRYRYALWRSWAPERPPLVFCLLNPSIADDIANDPTLVRCIERAHLGRYGGVRIVNLFALVSTDPAALAEVEDPVGPENDIYLRDATIDCRAIICGWGSMGRMKGRDQQVLRMLRAEGISTMALRLNKDGTPTHPCRLAYKLRPFAYTG